MSDVILTKPANAEPFMCWSKALKDTLMRSCCNKTHNHCIIFRHDVFDSKDKIRK